VENNCVHACGVEFYGAVGIWVGFAQGTTVSHNLVHDLPYSGISVGWEWGPSPTSCKANLVEYNHVYDVMNLLRDGGAIYTLGFQPGTIIRGNHLHGVHCSSLAQIPAENNGIFSDEGSKGFLFERNVIYDTVGEPVRLNQCSRDWHIWKDNCFGVATAAEAATVHGLSQTSRQMSIDSRLRSAKVALLSRSERRLSRPVNGYPKRRKPGRKPSLGPAWNRPGASCMARPSRRRRETDGGSSTTSTAADA